MSVIEEQYVFFFLFFLHRRSDKNISEKILLLFFARQGRRKIRKIMKICCAEILKIVEFYFLKKRNRTQILE